MIDETVIQNYRVFDRQTVYDHMVIHNLIGFDIGRDNLMLIYPMLRFYQMRKEVPKFYSH